jgi:hypothetical protein
MKITQGEALRAVSKSEYDQDINQRIALEYFKTNKEYRARFITTSGKEKDYAADFLVIVNEIIKPKRSHLKWLNREVIKISLSTVNLDNNTVAGEEDIYPILNDGILFNLSGAIFSNYKYPTGYLINGEDDKDAELTQLLATAPSSLKS